MRETDQRFIIDMRHGQNSFPHLQYTCIPTEHVRIEKFLNPPLKVTVPKFHVNLLKGILSIIYYPSNAISY